MIKTVEEVYRDFNKDTQQLTFGGWISNEDKKWLVDFLQTISIPKTIVEIGLFMGGTSNILLWLTGNSKYYGIDDWAAGNHQAKPAFQTLKEGFCKTTEWAKDRITLIEENSLSAGNSWNIPIDLLYVDGNHEYPYARSDISLFGRWIRPGGYILIDDYEMGGVIQATDELITSSPLWKVLRRPDFTNRNNPEKLYAARRI